MDRGKGPEKRRNREPTIFDAADGRIAAEFELTLTCQHHHVSIDLKEAELDRLQLDWRELVRWNPKRRG